MLHNITTIFLKKVCFGVDVNFGSKILLSTGLHKSAKHAEKQWCIFQDKLVYSTFLTEHE